MGNYIIVIFNALEIKVYEGAMDTVTTETDKVSQTTEIKDETESNYSSQVPVRMSRYKQKIKSDRAADKALRRISVHLVKELNLFETTLHLYAMDGLTPSEMERLRNHCETELEKRLYLVTTVIPSKGQYKGMKLLMRALRQTKQYEILSFLEKTYDEEVGKNPEINIPQAISSSSDEDEDVVISLDSVEQERQSEPDHVASLHNSPLGQPIQSVLPKVRPPYDINSGTNTATVTPLPPDPPIQQQELQDSIEQLIPLKFVFVGDTNTGKTSLLERYINNKFSIKTTVTVSVDYKSVEVTCYNTKYKLYLWDIDVPIHQEKKRNPSLTRVRNLHGDSDHYYFNYK